MENNRVESGGGVEDAGDFGLSRLTVTCLGICASILPFLCFGDKETKVTNQNNM
jgi:hypothetical protein